jgi:hypothetical protein
VHRKIVIDLFWGKLPLLYLLENPAESGRKGLFNIGMNIAA